MPRRELLTPTERLQLLAFPEDEGELIRLLTFTKADLAFVRQHRGDHNRLGIAVLMSYLRYPGRVLGEDEKPYVPVLNLAAEQLEISTAAWELYAGRDETRREHLLELFPLLGIIFYRRAERDVTDSARELAWRNSRTDQQKTFQADFVARYAGHHGVQSVRPVARHRSRSTERR